MLSIIGISMRGCLLVCSAAALSLSITLAKHQAVGQVPYETGLGAFAGAAGLFASVIGIAALWFDRINGWALIGLDAFVSVIYLASAISLTLAMQNVSSCTETDEASEYNRFTNKILNGGCVHTGKGPLCLNAASPDGKDLTPGRCQTAEANYTFEYGGFVFAFIMVLMGYVLSRRGRGGTPTTSQHYN